MKKTEIAKRIVKAIDVNWKYMTEDELLRIYNILVESNKRVQESKR